MDFINSFRGVKKMERDIYNELEVAWAEYEYVCQTIKARIKEIIDDGYEKLKSEYGEKVENYNTIEIEDSIIVIKLKPSISASTIGEIEKFLGINGRIFISGTKKNPLINLVFEKPSKPNGDSDDE